MATSSISLCFQVTNIIEACLESQYESVDSLKEIVHYVKSLPYTDLLRNCEGSFLLELTSTLNNVLKTSHNCQNPSRLESIIQSIVNIIGAIAYVSISTKEFLELFHLLSNAESVYQAAILNMLSELFTQKVSRATIWLDFYHDDDSVDIIHVACDNCVKEINKCLKSDFTLSALINLDKEDSNSTSNRPRTLFFAKTASGNGFEVYFSESSELNICIHFNRQTTKKIVNLTGRGLPAHSSSRESAKSEEKVNWQCITLIFRKGNSSYVQIFVNNREVSKVDIKFPKFSNSENFTVFNIGNKQNSPLVGQIASFFLTKQILNPSDGDVYRTGETCYYYFKNNRSYKPDKLVFQFDAKAFYNGEGISCNMRDNHFITVTSSAQSFSIVPLEQSFRSIGGCLAIFDLMQYVLCEISNTDEKSVLSNFMTLLGQIVLFDKEEFNRKNGLEVLSYVLSQIDERYFDQDFYLSLENNFLSKDNELKQKFLKYLMNNWKVFMHPTLHSCCSLQKLISPLVAIEKSYRDCFDTRSFLISVRECFSNLILEGDVKHSLVTVLKILKSLFEGNDKDEAVIHLIQFVVASFENDASPEFLEELMILLKDVVVLLLKRQKLQYLKKLEELFILLDNFSLTNSFKEIYFEMFSQVLIVFGDQESLKHLFQVLNHMVLCYRSSPLELSGKTFDYILQIINKAAVFLPLDSWLEALILLLSKSDSQSSSEVVVLERRIRHHQNEDPALPNSMSQQNQHALSVLTDILLRHPNRTKEALEEACMTCNCIDQVVDIISSPRFVKEQLLIKLLSWIKGKVIIEDYVDWTEETLKKLIYIVLEHCLTDDAWSDLKSKIVELCLDIVDRSFLSIRNGKLAECLPNMYPHLLHFLITLSLKRKSSSRIVEISLSYLSKFFQPESSKTSSDKIYNKYILLKLRENKWSVDIKPIVQDQLKQLTLHLCPEESASSVEEFMSSTDGLKMINKFKESCQTFEATVLRPQIASAQNLLKCSTLKLLFTTPNRRNGHVSRKFSQLSGLSLGEKAKKDNDRIEKTWESSRLTLPFFKASHGELKLYWKLCSKENRQRMRPKLEIDRYYELALFRRAAELRDNGGIAPQESGLESSEERLRSITAMFIGNLHEEPEECLEVEESRRCSISIAPVKCSWINLAEDEPIKTYLIIRGQTLIVHKIQTDEERHLLLSNLREIHPRRYKLRKTALELFMRDQTNYFFNFETEEAFQCIHKQLTRLKTHHSVSPGTSPARVLELSGLTQKWVNGKISNFEYLMQLNTIAGRSYNDINQYPIFPWVLKDYTSPVLNLKDPNVYRDLTRPIGAINPQYDHKLKEKYNDCNDSQNPNELFKQINAYHHSTHYSHGSGVLYYLLRLQPFTKLHVTLQSGRFDCADRQFQSIEKTWTYMWKSCRDCKELIPEFFCNADFLKNVNDLDLGVTQSGTPVGDVELPAWAASPEDFIYQHRKALESEYVSRNLHHWIDLIFGYKQCGHAAVDALNVYPIATYEGKININKLTEGERESLEVMVKEFGQTPCQLLKKEHPMRKDLCTPDTESNLKTWDLSKSDTMKFISLPSVIETIGIKTEPLNLVSVSRMGFIFQHRWSRVDHSGNIDYVIDPQRTIDKQKCCIGPLSPSLTYYSNAFVCSPLDATRLYCGGRLDNSITIYDLTKCRIEQTLKFHQDIVTCLSISSEGTYLLAGSKDATCSLWNLEQPDRIVREQFYLGHTSAVVTVNMLKKLDTLLSGSSDGFVNIHVCSTGEIYYRFQCRKYDVKSHRINHIVSSNTGIHVIQWESADNRQYVSCYSINGTELFNSKADCAFVISDINSNINKVNCISLYGEDTLLLATDLGIFYLHIFAKKMKHMKTQSEVLDICLANESTYMIFTLASGQISRKRLKNIFSSESS